MPSMATIVSNVKIGRREQKSFTAVFFCLLICYLMLCNFFPSTAKGSVSKGRGAAGMSPSSAATRSSSQNHGVSPAHSSAPRQPATPIGPRNLIAGPNNSKSQTNYQEQQSADYPSGLQYGDKPVPDQKFPTTDVKGKPFNPFDLSGTQDSSDESDENGSWTDYFPWNWGRKAAKAVSGWVWNSINNYLLKAVRSAFKSVMGFVADNVFQDLNLTSESKVIPIYRAFAWIVGAIFALLIVIVAIKSIMGLSLGFSDYRIKVMIPKIIFAAFCAIFALPICQVFINISHSASMAIIGTFNPTGDNAVGLPVQSIWEGLNAGSPKITSPLVLILLLFLVIGFVFLAVFYMIRKVALIFLVIVAPLAFALWIDDSTSNYAALWSKAFFALAFIEVIHALLIVLLFQILFSKGDMLASILYCFCLLYLFYKIPSLIFQSTVINWSPRPLRTIGTAGGLAYAGKSAAGISGG